MIPSTPASLQAQSEDLGRRSRNAATALLLRRSATEGTVAHFVEDHAKRIGTRLWLGVRRHSFISVTAAGAAGIGIATVLGAGELAVGAACAYACYNVWVRGESRKEALLELAQGLEGHH